MNKKIYKIICSLIGVIVLSLTVICSHDTYAGFKKSSSVYKKAVYSGVQPCYKKEYDKGGLRDKVNIQFGTDVSDYTFFNGSLYSLTKKDGGISIPLIGKTGSTNAVTNCADLLSVYIDNKIPTSETQIVQEKVESLGKLVYKEENDNKESASIKYPFGEASFVPQSTGNGKDSAITYKRTDPQRKDYELTLFRDSNNMLRYSRSDNLPFRVIINEAQVCVHQNASEAIRALFVKSEDCFDYSSNTDLMTILANIGNSLANVVGSVGVSASDNINMTGTYYWAMCSKWEAKTSQNRVECSSNSEFSQNVVYNGASKFQKPKWDSKSGDILSSLSNNGFSSYGGLKFSAPETYLLYYNYLINVYGVNPKKIECFDSEQNGKGTQVKLWWAEKKKYSKYCYVNPDNTDYFVNGVNSGDSKKVSGFGTVGKGHFGVPVTFKQMIKAMNNLNLSDSDVPDLSQITKSDVNDPRVNEDENKTSCESPEGKFSLAWMVCPVINALADTAQDAYEGFIEPTLQVSPTLFSQLNDSGENTTEAAWEVFRNFANIGFSIMLLVVILSQVTGFGIDNYGIKKVLPKLIIAAILINLSYLI